MVWEALGYYYVAVEAGEGGDGEDADSAETLWVDVQDVALGYVACQVTLCAALQAEECGGAGFELAFQGAAGDVGGLGRVFKQAVHNELILEGAFFHAAAWGVAAVEAHEQVLEGCALEIGLRGYHIAGNGVVYIQQGGGYTACQVAEVLAQGAVDVHFAGHWDTARCQAGVDVAGDEPERFLKRRPALVCEDAVAAGAEVCLVEPCEGKLKSGELGQEVGVSVTRAEFLCHVLSDGCDLRVILIYCVVEDEEVEFAVLHYFHAEVVEWLDGGVAGVEVLRARAECEYLDVEYAENHPGY